MNFAQLLIRCVTDNIEEPIRNNDGKAILDTIQILKSALQGEIARLLPDETPSSSLEDLGYESLDLLQKESCCLYGSLFPKKSDFKVHYRSETYYPGHFLTLKKYSIFVLQQVYYLSVAHPPRPSCQIHY